MRIGIIGGGAAGIFTAINAKDENNEVIIFERNKECGKKLLATGNGRCNYCVDFVAHNCRNLELGYNTVMHEVHPYSVGNIILYIE